MFSTMVLVSQKNKENNSKQIFFGSLSRYKNPVSGPPTKLKKRLYTVPGATIEKKIHRLHRVLNTMSSGSCKSPFVQIYYIAY